MLPAPGFPLAQVPRSLSWSHTVHSHQEWPCQTSQPALSNHPAAHWVGALKASSTVPVPHSPSQGRQPALIASQDIHNFSQ